MIHLLTIPVMLRAFLGVAVAGTIAYAQGPASVGPGNVLLVINDNSPVSKNIGEYYARRRGIPTANICRLRTASQETVQRTVFDREIARPIGQCLRTKALVEQVHYIVTTLGLPLRITSPDEGEGFSTARASVDSELTLLYTDLHGKPHRTAGRLPNPLFGQGATKFAHPQFPMYMVTRLAAYDFAGVRSIIDKALLARNRGKVVIDLKAGADTDGNAWLTNAAIRLPKDRVILDQSATVLYDQTDVIAYASWGSNDPARKRRLLGFKWLPGAIATEFVSTNGRTFEKPPDNWTLSDWKSSKLWFAGSPQTMTADFLLDGATGASGHVDEPYLGATPRPDLLLPAYLSGRNLAESYYLSIPSLSWMNIVIGDPLTALGR